MMTRIFLSAVLALLFITAGLPAGAQTSTDWDPRNSVPQIQTLGRVSPREQQAVVALRDHLVSQLSYWKKDGYPLPPPLDEILYFPDYNFPLVDLLQHLNPRTPDVVKHLMAQNQIFKASLLYRGVTAWEKKLKKPEGAFTGKIFDYFCMLRYGFYVPNMVDALAKKLSVADAIKDAQSPMPYTDNAFFYKTVDGLDLGKILKPDDGKLSDQELTSGKGAGELMQSVDMQAFGKMQTTNDEKLVERRIIILPRKTQGYDDMEMSTLSGPDVIGHEFGHHMNSGLAGPNSLPRSTDEMGADYLTASAFDNPLIGKKFAEASKTEADRLNKDGDPNDRLMALAYENIADQGVLRDLSQYFDNDTVPQSFQVTDDYTAGHPVRSFMWRMRQSSGDKKDAFESIFLQTLSEFAKVPAVQSPYARFNMTLRGYVLNIKRFVLTLHLRNKVASEVAAGKLSKEDGEIKLAQLKMEFFSKAEARMAKVRVFMDRVGMGSRPVAPQHYVNGEYFRTMYRVAQTHDPELAALVRKEAEVAMHSNSMIVKTSSGIDEIVFVRTELGKLNPAVVLKVKKNMNEIAKLRGEIQLLSSANLDETKDPASVVRLQNAVSQYVKRMDQIQEFERTNAVRKLYVAHPVLASASWALGKVSSKLSKKVQEGAQSFQKCLDLVDSLDVRGSHQ
jgi:hypothetical protein